MINMNKNVKTVEAVHTHTHTHTHSYSLINGAKEEVESTEM